MDGSIHAFFVDIKTLDPERLVKKDWTFRKVRGPLDGAASPSHEGSDSLLHEA
ncbi:hypothetical protein [Microvirga sp. KLBC 81]|uniref:hypothetical protein n=1 Tax=Microvirga sp. KLBC 81 TaxID=1862707 RepID=UPI001402B32D|nr:hypothetical protein [Microvirga sp. KLBC 81]